jgi:hypothetical protein
MSAREMIQGFKPREYKNRIFQPSISTIDASPKLNGYQRHATLATWDYH